RAVGIAALALFAVGGTAAWRGRSAARMSRAIGVVDPDTLSRLQRMGGAFASLADEVLRRKQIRVEQVRMVATSEELIRSTLPARLLRDVELIIDDALPPGAIHVAARDPSEGGGAILRVANVVRPLDLEQHAREIAAAQGYVGAARIWARIKQRLDQPLLDRAVDRQTAA